MATQSFKRNLLLILYRVGKKVWHLQPIFSTWGPLAFLPVTFSSALAMKQSASSWPQSFAHSYPSLQKHTCRFSSVFILNFKSLKMVREIVKPDQEGSVQLLPWLIWSREMWLWNLGSGPWRKAWQLTLVFLPGQFHGQRSLAGCSPQGCKESDMTEVTYHTHISYPSLKSKISL